MKNLFLAINILIAGVLFTSCSKVLDIPPTGQVNDLLMWQNQSMVQTYTANFYAQLPNGCNLPYKGGATAWLLSDLTDDAAPGSIPSDMSNFLNGTYNSTSSPLNASWAWTTATISLSNSYWVYIRKANWFLQNIDGVPGDKALNQRMKGEVLFIRAYLYYQLINWFGGVPIIKSAQTDLDSTAFVPRNTTSECTDFLVRDLTYAADSCLPNVYTSDQWGRVTKGAALALMSRLQLYAGRWADAAASANRVMNLGVYALQPSYASVFSNTNKTNNEILLAYQNNNNATQKGTAFDLINQPPGCGGRGYACPTQNLVDEYEMKATGLPINDPASGYDPQNPYAGRDPRFAATVLYDGCTFRNRPMQMYTGGCDVTQGVTANGSIPIQLPAFITRTGYYMRKFMDETIDLTNSANYSTSSQNWILIRYAEVLLNYAEAQNEAVGPDGSVYAAINAIRSRAGMPALKDGLSQDQMRAAIRHERRIELAFEDHRYWDVKRWKLATQLFSTSTNPLRKMTIVLNKTTGVKTYTPGNITETRVFSDKQYLFPIPLAEMTKPGNKLTQNPGWE